MGGTVIKIANCVMQLLPYMLQYVSMWMLVELLILYACQEKGVFVPEDGGVNSTENVKRGMFDCNEMGMPPVAIAVVFACILLPLVVYQVWAVFRQVRHSKFGTLEYMCYLEVAKERGSWFYKGLIVQTILVILISITVVIVAVYFLSDNRATWREYVEVLVKVAIRAALGLAKIPEMLKYDGPVNGKPHARLARYVLPGFDLSYSWTEESQRFMVKLQSILSMDPVIAEKLLIEATYMQQGDTRAEVQKVFNIGDAPEEGSKEDREADVDKLLEDGIPGDKLVRVSIGKGRGNTLGGGMGHVDARVFSSLGQGCEDFPQYIGKFGEDTRPMVQWAESYGDGGETMPLDEHPRAKSAQMRFREMEWFFGDPHARLGLESHLREYSGPPETPDAAGARRAASRQSPPKADAGNAPDSAPPPESQFGAPSNFRRAMVLWSDGRRYPGMVGPVTASGCTVYWEDGRRCDNIPPEHCTFSD
eukprot:TRINITY_DN43417_c0_g1_i1.p1 TRINITY_DN43417_c0_g1~~TRINITY_DN43417_c0_g1_i1.p1  ORF type:complete len:499 (+),score=171.16 TRINITY_DN43417_c0_g1_i1:69-1499(+)